jgi:hypothetical protein
MDATVSLHRPAGESHRVPSVFVPEERPRTRPKTRYRARLNLAADVEVARKEGLPVYLLTPEIISAFRYPIRFPPRLLVAREVSPAVDSAFRRIVFNRREAAASPRFEDLVVAMLEVDPLAARALVKRNPDLLDPVRLLVRVVEENAERPATLVRLHEFAPGIPKVGEAIRAEALSRSDRNNVIVGLRA